MAARRVGTLSRENSAMLCPTAGITPIDFKGENSTLSNDAFGPSSLQLNENPGALAGATGAVFEVAHFKTAHYRKRAESATALCHAIAECDPDDAVVLMSAALVSLSVGAPLPIWIDTVDEARWWARLATELELKAWALASFEALRPKARSAFLAYAQGRAVA